MVLLLLLRRGTLKGKWLVWGFVWLWGAAVLRRFFSFELVDLLVANLEELGCLVFLPALCVLLSK